MAINFPTTGLVTNTTTYTVGNRTWLWTGYAWRLSGLAFNSNYYTRTATGNNSTTTYTISNGLGVDNVIVTLDGISQTPTTDYTISGTTLTFTTAPYSGAAIVIRELPH